MKLTHPNIEDFNSFRESVRSIGRTFLLKTGKFNYEHAESDWRSFLNSVSSEQPLLAHYEDSWPTEYYYNYLRSRRKEKAPRKQIEVPEPAQVIARPEGKKLFFRLLADLEQFMKNTHPDRASFERFTKQVKIESRKIEAKYRSEQDDAVWDGFIRSMMAIDSSLQRYEDAWPLEYYFNALVKGRKDSRNRANRPRVRKRRETWRALCPIQATPLNSSPQPISSQAILHDRETTTQLEEKQTVLLAPCFFCHGSPIAEPSFARNLGAFLEHDQALIMELARLGVSQDNHLDFLLSLPPIFLERTIVSIPTVQLSPISKCRLLDLFERHRNSQQLATRSDKNSRFVLLRTPCRTHKSLDTPDTTFFLRDELHTLGLAELIPALAHMEIIDETMFAHFKQMGDKQRLSLVDKYHLHLTDFHFFMIGVSCGSKLVRETGWVSFDF
ncbi:hypothetical protein CPB83DRAFT_856923 [Crepidotus variabilis]|uniref:Uncharacterized protein n=1 Tax=Crepidotus variabilis TaxID=179855 RepID=A0A9P6JNN3_9AGAR|nr:hypothetical protein CPB83DRAFT_856923 [Crepidotus variabilis]